MKIRLYTPLYPYFRKSVRACAHARNRLQRICQGVKEEK
nr:MAG TPA: hypothetical protein [Caudoviricetes sp.]